MKHEDWEELIRLHAHINAAKPRYEELKQMARQHLEEGHTCPDDMPYLIVLQPRESVKRDWESITRRLLFRLYRTKAKVEEWMGRYEEEFPRETTHAVTVKENYEYAKRLAAD